MEMQYVTEISHVPSIKAAVSLPAMNAAFKGKTVARNLSVAINTRLRTDTMPDTLLKISPLYIQ